MKHFFLTTVFITFTLLNVLAQKNIIYYQFTETIETFSSISATGTNLGSGDDTEFPLDLSSTFSFTFNENSYSQFTVGVNGAIVLGTTTADVSSTNNIDQSSVTPIIAPYWDDMDMSVTGGAIFYELTGTAGTQILTIEWHDTETYDDSKQPQSTNVSYQLKLYEDSGEIKFVYGDMSNAANWYPQGGSIGFIDNESGTLGFLSVTPGNPATYSTSAANDNITKAEMAAIPTGTTYSFSYVIPSCNQPNNLTATDITYNSAVISWNETGTATHWDIEYDISGFAPTGTPTIDDVTDTSYSLGSLSPETAYQFYVRADCGANNTDVSYWTGPYEFTTLASCPEPTDLYVLHETDQSVYLGWSQTGGNNLWDIELGTGGFTPTGTPTYNDINTRPYFISSLSSSTAYDFYVRSDCGAEQSDWVGPYSFTTLCPVVSPEFIEYFSVYPPNGTPPCWQENRGTIADGPIGTQNISNWGGDGFANNGTTGSAKINLHYNTVRDWLISPLMDLSAGGYELNFDVALTKFYDTIPEEMGSDDEIQLIYTTDGLNWTNLYTWSHGNEPSNTGDNINLDITNITGATVRFAFWASDGEIDDTKDYEFFVDNFTVRTQPGCPVPSLLSAVNISSVQADLTWMPGGSETTWDIEWGLANFTPTGTPTIDDVTTNPFTITDLSANTSYDFYVRADCGANNIDVSDWAGPYQFTTAYTVPFTENFDTFLPQNWREGKAILSENTDVTIMLSEWDHDDYLNLYTNNPSAAIDIWGTYRQDWIITPLIDLGTTDCELQFNLALTDIDNSNPPEAQGEDNKFAVIISPDGGETWSSLNALQMWDNTTTPSFYDIPHTGQTVSLDLSSYSGTIMLGFYGESTVYYTNEYNDLFVDDINISQTVDVKEPKLSEDFIVYPNPTAGIINFDFLNSNVKKISILDVTGKVIVEKTINNQTDDIDISNYADGLYLIKLQTDKKEFTKKILKK
jgi:hypothetical protein